MTPDIGDGVVATRRASVQITGGSVCCSMTSFAGNVNERSCRRPGCFPPRSCHAAPRSGSAKCRGPTPGRGDRASQPWRKPFEDRVDVLRRNARSAVRDRDLPCGRATPRRYTRIVPPDRRKFDRVADEVLQHLQHPAGIEIGRHLRRSCGSSSRMSSRPPHHAARSPLRRSTGARLPGTVSPRACPRRYWSDP